MVSNPCLMLSFSHKNRDYTIESVIDTSKTFWHTIHAYNLLRKHHWTKMWWNGRSDIGKTWNCVTTFTKHNRQFQNAEAQAMIIERSGLLRPISSCSSFSWNEVLKFAKILISTYRVASYKVKLNKWMEKQGLK